MRNVIEFNALDEMLEANPYSNYMKMHNANSVLYDRQMNAYFFGHHEDVVSILRSPDFTTEPLADRAQPVMGGRVLAQMEGREHRSKRHAILQGLSGNKFREHYACVINDLTSEIISNVAHTGQIDLINEFGKEYSILVALKILGLPTDNHKEIAIWHAGITTFITSMQLTSEQRHSGIECSRRLIEYLTPLVDNRDTLIDESLLGAICRTQHDGSAIDTAEVIALTLNVLLAAVEPADKTLAYLFYHLLQTPDQFKAVKVDRALLAPAIRETLRLTSPVQLIPRQASHEANISGVVLKKDSLVFCMVGAANRDPSVFSHPSTFDPTRWGWQRGCTNSGRAPQHLAFGIGPHACVGAAFSLLQIELTANVVMDKLEGLELEPGFVLEETGLYTRGPSALRLRFCPHFRAAAVPA